MGRFKVLTIVPAYNEEKTISKVIKDLKKYSDVLVIDDHSNDKTYQIVKKHKSLLIRNKKNLGYEKSLEVGLFKSIKLNYDFAITFDGDGQHHASDIKKFLHHFRSGYELVLGDRSLVTRFSEKLAKYLFYKKWGIMDPYCGFKGYKLNKISKYKFFERYHSVGLDLSLTLIESGARFKNVKILTSKRFDHSKFGNLIIGNLKILRSIFLSFVKH